MSQLEIDLKDSLSVLMMGERITLDRQKQEKLSHYFVMKGMVLDWFDGAPLFDVESSKAFFDERVIPQNSSIHFFNCISGPWRCAHQTNEVSLLSAGEVQKPHEYNTKLIALGFANLFVLIFFSKKADLGIRFDQKKALCVYPYSDSSTFEWPPDIAITSLEAHIAANCLNLSFPPTR